jgi:hypothetical protein
MRHLSEIAVPTVEEQCFSPEDMIMILGLSCSAIYARLKRLPEDGRPSLDIKKAHGAPPIVTEMTDVCLKRKGLESPPENFQ